MLFPSPLQVIRKLRQSQERQQELLLMEVNQRVSALQHEIETVKAQLIEGQNQQLRKLQSQVTASELHFDALCRATLVLRQQALAKNLAAELSERERRITNLQAAHQRREKVETMLGRHSQFRKRKEIRQEQQAIDEMFLLRLPRRK